jgi:beta-lactam-binding protein with PASTA domain
VEELEVGVETEFEEDEEAEEAEVVSEDVEAGSVVVEEGVVDVVDDTGAEVDC